MVKQIKQIAIFCLVCHAEIKEMLDYPHKRDLNKFLQLYCVDCGKNILFIDQNKRIKKSV